ncbi:MAG TPA: DUF2852 domain-containing protein [Afipia sp.]
MVNISDANTADFDRRGRPAWAGRGFGGGSGPERFGGGGFGPRDFQSHFDGWHRGPHPGQIILVIAAFAIWWPLGLAALAFTFWRRKMGCWNHHGRFADKMERAQWKMERMRGAMEGRGFSGFSGFSSFSSGNRAFDDYRMETLRRLEEEQKEFRDFLDRLRHAKDKEEFDAFMAQHRPSPTPPNDQPQG